jgi:hypothetical protein
MFDKRNNPEQWGRQLTARNLDELLRQQREARDEYVRTHQDDVTALETLVPKAVYR